MRRWAQMPDCPRSTLEPGIAPSSLGRADPRGLGLRGETCRSVLSLGAPVVRASFPSLSSMEQQA
jgi:hypothetical protein